MDKTFKRLAFLLNIAADLPSSSRSTTTPTGESGPCQFGVDAGGPWVSVAGGERLSLEMAEGLVGHILVAMEEARQMEWAMARGLKRFEQE